MENMIDDALKQIASLTDSARVADTDGEPLSVRVAEALGWASKSGELETIKISSGGLNLVHGYVGPQRAIVFAADGAGAAEQLLPDAARFAYHSSVPWGLIADERGAIVFNSHWILNENWFQLPRIRWAELDRHREVIRAVTPDGVVAGRLEKIAADISVPDRFLAPVDDALVRRLDYWRAVGLRHGRVSEKLDEDLHTLFAQLFVLRAVEDRGLAPEIPVLESTIVEQGINVVSLHELFRRARDAIQSNLFALDSLDRFPEFMLAGIISDLYTPTELPQESQRYNFAWINSDILGRAYEKYLANVFEPAPPLPQLALFDQPLREIEPVSIKKSGGVYYTPSYLVSSLADQTIGRVLSEHDDPHYIPRVADFACGSGSFLVEAVGILLSRLRELNPKRNWARTLVDGKHIIGIDSDPRAVTLSRLNLWIRLTEEPNALPLPSIDEIIVLGDSLGEEIWQSLPKAYDVVLGNPPFIATGSTRPRSELSRRFRTARGRFDYAYLFVELAVARLTSGGLLGMVVPNRLFRNRDARAIREILTNEAVVLGVIDFGANEVFVGTSAYIGAIIAKKLESQEGVNPDALRAILVSDVSETRYLAGTLVDALAADHDITTPVLTAFNTAYPVNDLPWLLLSPSDRRARFKLEQDSIELGEFAGIFQGIRTGANDIFLVRQESSDGTLSRIVNGLGDSDVIETRLLYPVVFGSDIRRYVTLRPEHMLVYPYYGGALLSEEQLREEFPRAYDYLSSYRELLSTRSITARGHRWYELAWRRDEAWLRSRKLLTRDLAPRTSFSIDSDGEVFLVGGTAVVPPDPMLALPLLAYINSSVANDYLVELTPSFRGGFQKFEPQHLARLPVPRFIAELNGTAAELAQLVLDAIEAWSGMQEDLGRSVDSEINRIIAEQVGFNQ